MIVALGCITVEYKSNHSRMQSFTVDPVNMSKSVQSLSRSLQQQTGPHSDLGGCAAGIRPTCFSKYQDRSSAVETSINRRKGTARECSRHEFITCTPHEVNE